MSLLFLFVDGVGIGPSGRHNPLSTVSLPGLERLAMNQPITADLSPDSADSHVARIIDARLGMEGLPQSGTGQATLFTGINCASAAGRHYGPFPHTSSRPIIEEHGILRSLVDGGHSPAFANAYPDRFFSYIETTRRWTVTTLCCHLAGVELRGESALRAHRAIPANITGHGWPGHHFDPLTEEQAARNLIAITEQHAFTLFEYFLTDKAGHGRGNVNPRDVLESLDRFIGHLLDLQSTDLTILLTSDHGNLEDVSTRSHTLNPVPLLVSGPLAHHFTGATTLMDVTPAALRALKSHITDRDDRSESH
jgi:2,3-bisphosphoglycerate-independent phosphoglycerate mutase